VQRLSSQQHPVCYNNSCRYLRLSCLLQEARIGELPVVVKEEAKCQLLKAVLRIFLVRNSNQ